MNTRPVKPQKSARPSLSHVVEGPRGSRSRMVDVGKKAVTRREAVARARLRFPAPVGGGDSLRDRVLAGRGPKGPIEEVARCAGVLAAKRTWELIPLCHPLALDQIEIDLAPFESDGLEVECRVRCQGRTGVEMEALTGATIAALTVYDMTKALEKGIRIEAVELLEKRGGRSGHWKRPGAARAVRGKGARRRS